MSLVRCVLHDTDGSVVSDREEEMYGARKVEVISGARGGVTVFTLAGYDHATETAHFVYDRGPRYWEKPADPPRPDRVRDGRHLMRAMEGAHVR